MASLSETPGPAGPEGYVLRAEIGPIRAAYRYLTDQVENRWIPLVDQVDRAIEPAARKFTMRVGFPEGNPYFGLLIAHRPEVEMRRFHMDFREDEAVSTSPRPPATLGNGLYAHESPQTPHGLPIPPADRGVLGNAWVARTGASSQEREADRELARRLGWP